MLGNAQLAQIVGARGPNMQTNAACAGSTLAVAMAQVSRKLSTHGTYRDLGRIDPINAIDHISAVHRENHGMPIIFVDPVSIVMMYGAAYFSLVMGLLVVVAAVGGGVSDVVVVLVGGVVVLLVLLVVVVVGCGVWGGVYA